MQEPTTRQQCLDFLSALVGKPFDKKLVTTGIYKELADIYNRLKGKPLRRIEQLLWLFSVEKIDLSGQRMKAIPSALFLLDQLTELRLNNNEIAEIPDEISVFQRLEKLYLHYNEITKLPEAVSELQALELLDADWGKLELPTNIHQLEKIKKIEASHRGIQTLPPSFFYFSQIEALHLQGNKLSELPMDIDKLVNLTILDIGNNALTALPETIGNLQQLRQLHIDKNQIKKLPKSIKKLAELSELELYGNGMSDTELAKIATALPDCYIKTEEQQTQIIELLTSNDQSNRQLALALEESQDIDLSDFWRSLRAVAKLTHQHPKRKHLIDLLESKMLSLMNKELKQIPDCIGVMTHIQVLTLGNNLLENEGLSKVLLTLKQLKYLNLSSNVLTALPAWFSQLPISQLELSFNLFSRFPIVICRMLGLKYLEIGANSFSSLPEEISNLQALNCLTLDSNKINRLPESIGELRQLEKLFLGENQLTSLPNGFSKLSKLTELELGNNPLKEFPAPLLALSQLQILSLAHTMLSRLPDNIGDLTNLQQLWLSGNALEQLPESIGNCHWLTSINLNSNQLKTLPESIGNLTALHILYLSNNRLEKLPKSMAKLSNLEQIYLDGNCLNESDIYWLREQLPNCRMVSDFEEPIC